MQDYGKIKIGVIGVGYLGSYHIQQYQQINNIELVGCYDINHEALTNIKAEYNINIFDSLDELLVLCDAVSIVTPTNTHFEVAKKALSSNCHVLIEKPITQHIDEAQELLLLATKKIKLFKWDMLKDLILLFIHYKPRIRHLILLNLIEFHHLIYGV